MQTEAFSLWHQDSGAVYHFSYVSLCDSEESKPSVEIFLFSQAFCWHSLFINVIILFHYFYSVLTGCFFRLCLFVFSILLTVVQCFMTLCLWKDISKVYLTIALKQGRHALWPFALNRGCCVLSSLHFTVTFHLINGSVFCLFLTRAKLVLCLLWFLSGQLSIFSGEGLFEFDFPAFLLWGDKKKWASVT